MANVRRYDQRNAVDETREEVFHIRPLEMPMDEEEDLMATRLEAQAAERREHDPEVSADADAEKNPPTPVAAAGAVGAEPKPDEKPEETPAGLHSPTEADLAKPAEPTTPEKEEKPAEPAATEPTKPVEPAKPSPQPVLENPNSKDPNLMNPFMAPTSRDPELPVRSSATIDYAPYDGDVVMSGTLVREAQYVIDTLHDANRVDPRLKTLAIQAIASDDAWAEEVFRKAKNRKPVTYRQQNFYYLIDKSGRPRQNSALFPSFEAAKNSFGPQRLNELTRINANFSKLIGSAPWYIDADGKRIQPVSKGEPKAPPAKIDVPASVVDHGAEYLRRFHDTGVIHPDLANLLEQILLSDEAALSAAKAEKARRDLARRPKMKVGYYTTDRRRPAETPELAKKAYLDSYERRFGSEFMDLVEQGDATIPIPDVQATAYFVSEFGGFGEPVDDRNLAKACLREAGLLDDSKK